MLMVRFFCGEMGLALGRNRTDLEERPVPRLRFPAQQFTLAEAQRDSSKYQKLLVVMKAANRAVAHIDEADVDHPIKADQDHDDLCEVIDWIEELIRTHIYEPHGWSLEKAMEHPWNVMASAEVEAEKKSVADP